ncbi:MAG: LrgB family protein [Myxococcaceae bacterium]
MSLVPTVLATLGTVVAYLLAERLYRRFHWVLLHPLLVTSVVGAVVLGPRPDVLQEYVQGSWLLVWALGPATAALAIPFFQSRAALASNPAKVLLSVVVGTAASVATVLGLGTLLGVDAVLLRGLTIKSVTAPVAIALAPELGVDPGVVSCGVVATGLFGMAVGPSLLRLLGVRRPLARGLALGTIAHAMGTARALEQDGPEGGAGGAVALALVAILLSIAVAVVH